MNISLFLFQTNPHMSSSKKKSKVQKTLGWAATGIGLYLVAHAVVKEITKFKLQGKVVLITGGSRGLGLVLARQLAGVGARLAICARSADRIELARQELEKLGAEVWAMAVDVTDKQQVETMVRDVISKFGTIDVLINNAGIIQVGPEDAMTLEDYEASMNTNFYAPLYTIHSVLPHFRSKGEGRIVNITSIGGKIAVPHLLPYTASKSAFVGFSEGLHNELKKFNIHVTTVVPNLMTTGSPRNVTVKGDHEAEYSWFKISDSSVLAQSAETAAHRIIKSLEYGESEAILSLTGKLATVVKGIAPGWVGMALTLANNFLPANATGGTAAKKGYEVENSISNGKLARRTNVAAVKNNER
jgi:short-subunit dehydrogenase